jgi:hypothetical protein
MESPYGIKKLLKMLETAIEVLIENEICSCCKIFHNKDHRCSSGDYCEKLIFDGLFTKGEHECQKNRKRL